jgi:hypothetical protein
MAGRCCRVQATSPAAFIVLILACACMPALAEERVLVRSNRLGIQAYYDAKPNWCGYRVKLKHRAFDLRAFTDSSEDLQRLIGGARVALSSECPVVSELQIEGEVSGEIVWRAICSESMDWRVQVINSATDSGTRRSN